MRNTHRARVLLGTTAWKTMLLDAFGRQEIEACGALLGTIDPQGSWLIETAIPLRNSAASPVYFEFDPAELLRIDLEQPGRMVGVYHSHPAGPALASSIDRQNMRRVNLEQAIPWVWLIVSGPFSQVQATRSVGSVESPPTATISASGLIAYHHYEAQGLQKIPIVQGGSEDGKPLQHL